MAALLPPPQPNAEDGVRASAARGMESRVCWLRRPVRGWKHATQTSDCCACWRGSVSAFHPGAAVSRGSVARQCARCGAAGDADGGGRPNTSGTMGSGARNIVANSAGRSTLRCRAVRTTLARTCWVSAPFRVRLPPHTLRMTTAGRMACSARQLVASTDGSHRKVKRAPNSLARCAAKRSASSCGGGLSISRLSWASSRPRTVARPWSLIPPAVAPVAQREGCLQGVLHLAGPSAVGLILEQLLTAS